jgi:Tfp pilus assembly protein PilF
MKHTTATAALGYPQAMSQPANPAARLERLEPLLRVEPDNLPLHRECVQLAMEGRAYERALQLVEARLSRHPAEAEAQFARSNALIGLQRFDDALQILKALEAQGVTATGVLANLALCHFALGNFANTRAYAEQLLAAGEVNADTVRLAVSSLHFLGEMDAAVALADQHAALGEQNGGLAGVFAMAYLDSNDAPKAAKFATVALQHNPDSIDGLIVSATLAASEMEVEKATQQYARAVQLAPRNGRGWLGLGLMAFQHMEFPAAREFLQRGLETLPDHVGSWLALGWSHLVTGEVDAAEKYFNHALELDRNFAESHGAVAAIYAMRGDRAAAERHIEIAERLDRTGLSVHYAHAVLKDKDGGNDAGRRHILETMRRAAPRFGGKAAEILKSLTDEGLNRLRSS